MDGKFLRHGPAALLLSGLLCLTAPAAAAGGTTPLTTVRIASGLSSPTYVTAAPGDPTRLFVLEQGGRIRLIKNGTLLATPFLDFSGAVSSFLGETGALGLAFDPDYASNGFFYVSYTRRADDANVIFRYSVTANPDIATSTGRLRIFGPISQPFSNHNGGCIQISPNDRKLYVGVGDGGSAGDPGCRAQNGSSLLGKMLRINLDGTVPADNPFVGNPDFNDAIWAYGLRNPWRFSFDRANGDLYIGDVGQNAREEIDYVRGVSTGGENYGWKMMEGNSCFSTSGCASINPPIVPCNDSSLTDPIHQYTHSQGCSVTGGYVYRGCAIPDLQGTYFFSDFCSATIWSFDVVAGALTNFQNRTTELAPNVGSINSVASFGEDAQGELYIVDLGGEVFKIQPAAGITDTNSNGIADQCEASSVVRNGSGCNPLNYNEVTPPVLGTTWTTTITLGGGDIASILAIGLGGATTSPCFTGPFLVGEVLIAGPNLEPLNISTGTHNFPLPNDYRLIGQTVATQGYTFQPGQLTLYNAIDITLGL